MNTPTAPPTAPPPAAAPEPAGTSRKKWYIAAGITVAGFLTAIALVAPAEPEVEESAPDPTEVVEETVAPTTEAPATTQAPTTTQAPPPPMPEPAPMPEPVDAWDLSGWPSLQDYCFTDCSSIYQAEMLSYFVEADPSELGRVLDYLNTVTWGELDAVCNEFFTMTDAEVFDLAYANGVEPIAWNTALYMVCDS
jgi:hypothetical protein